MSVYDEFAAGLLEAESMLTATARGHGGTRIPGGRFRLLVDARDATGLGPFDGVWSPFTPSKADLQETGVRTDVQFTIIATRAQFPAKPQERWTVFRVDDSASFSVREVTEDEVSFTLYVAVLT